MNGIYFFVLFLSLFFAYCWTTPDLFAWLSGTWEMKNANGSSRLEVWERKNNYTFTGKGLKVKGQDTTLLETIELVFQDDHYWYVPTVPDQNNAMPVLFKLVTWQDFQFTFENPEHDFPQRIIYLLKPAGVQDSVETAKGDTLIVRVESMAGDGLDFRFIRK